MSIRAILFDLDGVLASSKDLHYETLNHALNDFGGPIAEISRAEHLAVFDGLPTKRKLAMLIEQKRITLPMAERVSAKKQEYTAEAIKTHDFGVRHRALLARLKKEDIILAVCSNAIHNTVVGILDNIGIIDYFSHLFTNECVANGKPSPDIYLHAMNVLEVYPDETIILEDSAHGLEAALASGALVKKINIPEDLYNFHFSNR